MAEIHREIEVENPAKALGRFRDTFTAHDFRVLTNSDEGVEVESTQQLMNSRQSPILGISRASAWVRDGKVVIEADLGGLRGMQKFVKIFPPALAGGLLLIFTITFGATGKLAELWFVPVGACLLTYLPWVFLAPWMNRMFERRANTAVDTLVQNMQTLSKGS